MAMAERLNAAADSLSPAELARGTIGWVIQRYRDSDEYRDLSLGTVKYYKRFLREIEALGPALPFASFTRRAVVDFIESYSKAHQRRQSAAVLKNLFKLARYHGVVAADETAGLRLKTSRPRDRIWTDEEIARWIGAAGAEDPHMTTAFLLLQFTAQRPNDVLRMAWPQYSGSAIRLRQQHLYGLTRSGSSLTIVTFRGRPVKYVRFNERYAGRRCSGWRKPAPQYRRSRVCQGTRSRRRNASSRPICRGTVTLAEIAITRLAEYKKRPKSSTRVQLLARKSLVNKGRCNTRCTIPFRR
jgi:hypothetical protein